MCDPKVGLRKARAGGGRLCLLCVGEVGWVLGQLVRVLQTRRKTFTNLQYGGASVTSCVEKPDQGKEPWNPRCNCTTIPSRTQEGANQDTAS